MTADTVTPQRLDDLAAALATASNAISTLYWEVEDGTLDPAEAAAIVNETITNLVNEAR